MRFPVIPAFLALALAGSAALAQASVDDEARRQFDAGVELFEKGQFAQAAIAFARAYELKPSFKLLYNIGQVENELGHYAAALAAYTRYLAEGGDQIEAARREELKKELARLDALVGQVVVEASAVGATIFLDGRKSGVTPLAEPLLVDLGEHEVRLVRGAEDVYREIVKVAGGQRVVVKAEIAGALGEAEGAGAEAGSAEPEEHRAPGPKRVWTWVAIGLGGAAAIGAGVTGGLSISKANDVKDQCDGNVCSAGLEDDADAAKALGNTATALVAVAGVGLAAGIIFYFVEPKWGEGGVEIAPVALPADGGAAFALAGRF